MGLHACVCVCVFHVAVQPFLLFCVEFADRLEIWNNAVKWKKVAEANQLFVLSLIQETVACANVKVSDSAAYQPHAALFDGL